jgi:D-alanyl-D-alanine carboxypeptidase (penicillin-binding protein 5/6)
MKQTYFTNPHGLDPFNIYEAPNVSSPQDLSILVSHIIENYPLLFDILSLREFNLYTPDGQFHHTLRNTNILLERAWPAKVIGGKTGYTLRANGTLVIILETPDQKGTLTNIVLGANDRFKEMENLTSWVFTAYRW